MNHPNKTAEYFYKISYMSFLFGMPNFWIDDLRIPKPLVKYYTYLSKFCDLTFFVLIPFEIASFVTQNDMNIKQKMDLCIYSIGHSFLLMYLVVITQQEDGIKMWIAEMLEMRAVYNDRRVEDQMVRKSALTSSILGLSIFAAMILYTLNAYMQVKSGGTFTTLITAWPPVNELSTGADAVRYITNFVWWILVFRTISIYTFVISLTTCMSFQFKNLQSYFRSLDGIFQEDLKQSEMERKYEDGLKTGIKLHSVTFECINRVKNICGGVLSGCVVFAILLLVFHMYQMLMSERTLVNAIATGLSASVVLSTAGLFMCNAGDITIEASHLATAMYSSGWQNCRGRSSVRVRRLLVIAMICAQKPVVLKGLGIMELSYQSYVDLVKTSYSVFSVLY